MKQSDLNRFINSLLDDLVKNNFYPILCRTKYMNTITFHPMFLCDFTQLENILITHLERLRKFSVTKDIEVRYDDDSVFIQFFVHENGTNEYRQGFSCEFTIKSKSSIKTVLEYLPLTDHAKVSEALKDLSLTEGKEAKIRIVDLKY